MAAESNTSEHALSLIKAGIAGVPVVGGPIASLIGDYVPTATQRSIDRAIELLSERLRKLEGRLDVEAVDKDEFAELFKSSYLSIVRSHNESKLRGATAILANLLLEEGDAEKLTYTELDHFARCVETLSGGAVEVLGAVVREARSEGRADGDEAAFRVNFSQINDQFNHLSPHLLMGLVGELDAANLLHRGNTPTIRTTNYANYPIELTPLGKRFARFVLES
ncbi:hypothetical protein [Arhodomonas aquaeolei]|uniref:hypothetical protein n=1 Tax=Arhodomonas aquaeolei TaxID=2369 RepID=UPI0012EC59BC|nr:hypothetical protein [Arhodomonas aquaeolei]